MNLILRLYHKYLAPIIRQKIKQIVLSELDRLVLQVITEKAKAKDMPSVPLVTIASGIIGRSEEVSRGNTVEQVQEVVNRLTALGLIRSRQKQGSFSNFESYEITTEGENALKN
jgi:hypothetical protein